MLDWLWKLKDWTQHTIIAAAMMIFVGLVTLNPLAGWAFGVAFYYGREVRDMENKEPTLFNNVKVLAFWNWNKDSFKDFVFPLIGNTLLYIFWELIF